MKYLLLIVVALLFCITEPTASETRQEETSGTPSEFKQIMLKHYVAGTFHGGALYSYSHGKTHNIALGIANPDTGESLNSEHHFAINSMGKMFTAILIMQLVEEGQVKLTDSIEIHLPDFSHPKAADISIHLLLSHRSGLPDYFLNQLRGILPFDLTQSEVLDKVAMMPLDFEPNSAFQYSNTGYLLLGEIIRRYRNGSFEDSLKAHIFTKLGMHDSAVSGNENSIKYFREDGSTQDYKPDMDYIGDGQGSSSLMDMYRFMSSIYSPVILSKSSWDLMFTEHSLPSEVPDGAWPPPHQYPYGYGFGIMTLDVSGSKFRIVGHGGAGYGSNYAGRFLDSEKVIVIYNNMMKDPILLDVLEFVAQQ